MPIIGLVHHGHSSFTKLTSEDFSADIASGDLLVSVLLESVHAELRADADCVRRLTVTNIISAK